jgi:hypothetical protein
VFDNKIVLNSVNNLWFGIIRNSVIHNFNTYFASTSEDRKLRGVNLVFEKREKRNVCYLVRKPVCCMVAIKKS